MHHFGVFQINFAKFFVCAADRIIDQLIHIPVSHGKFTPGLLKTPLNDRVRFRSASPQPLFKDFKGRRKDEKGYTLGHRLHDLQRSLNLNFKENITAGKKLCIDRFP